MIPLAGHLVDAVDVDGAQEMVFVHGHVIRLTVDLSSARKNNFDVFVVIAAGFENGQLRSAVDLQVVIRVLHGV